MRVDDALPPSLPERPRANAGINLFSSSMESQMQVLEAELPVLAAAAVESEVEGNAPSRVRRPARQSEDGETDCQQRKPESGAEKPNLHGSAGESAQGSRVTSIEEDDSPRHELDVRL